MPGSFFLACCCLAAILSRSAAAVDEIRTRLTAAEELADVKVSASDWPWWRGPNRNNVAAPQPVPVRWDAPEVTKWKVAVPGRGHASPITWGERLFVLTADEE